MKANVQKKKITGNGFLLLITIALFCKTSDVSEPVCI